MDVWKKAIYGLNEIIPFDTQCWAIEPSIVKPKIMLSQRAGPTFLTLFLFIRMMLLF